MKKAFKYILILFFLPPLFYGMASLIGALIPVNNNRSDKKVEISIYLQQFGSHTDIVLPYKNEVQNWGNIVNPSHTKLGNLRTKYLSFGWGDLAFYRNTPTWNDLTLNTAFTALFTKSPAAIHVKFSENLPQAEKSVQINLNKNQYKKLCAYIENDFKTDKKGKLQQITDLFYTQTDAFYKACGSLSLFKTCNTWVNSGLKHTGVKTCLWTAFPQGIFYQNQ